MINPDEVRTALRTLGAPEVRRQIAAGELGGDAKAIAVRWLASIDEKAIARRTTDDTVLLRMVRLTLVLAILSAGASIISALLVFRDLSQHH